MPKCIVTVTIKKGPKTLAVIEGLPMDGDAVKMGDILDAEPLMERLTGLRFHVHAELVPETK